MRHPAILVEPMLLSGRRCCLRLSAHAALPWAALTLSVVSVGCGIAALLKHEGTGPGERSALDNVLLTGELRVLSPPMKSLPFPDTVSITELEEVAV